MKADVVVVGAGALGLSTALHLALLGRVVVVIERDKAGSQASGRAAGLFKSIQADELRTRLARRSIERAQTYEEWAGTPLSVTRSGSLAIARTPAHTAFLADEVSRSRTWGVPIVDLDERGLAGASTLFHPTGRETAWQCPEDIYVEEPMALVAAYVAASRLHGVEIREDTEVTGIELVAGAVRAVRTTGSDERIETTAVVDAAGAWTRQVAALAGAWVGVAPVRHQLLITQPTTEVDPTDPIVRVVDSAVYVRPARGGLMLGGFEADPMTLSPSAISGSFDTDDLDLDPAVLERLAATVQAEVPTLDPQRRGGRSSTVAEHRGGMFTMTPDGRFAAGAVPDVEGLWVASGCNGSGFSSSLGIGEALAATIAGTQPFVDLAPLRPGRIGRRDDDALAAAGAWQYAHYYGPASTP